MTLTVAGGFLVIDDKHFITIADISAIYTNVVTAEILVQLRGTPSPITVVGVGAKRLFESIQPPSVEKADAGDDDTTANCLVTDNTPLYDLNVTLRTRRVLGYNDIYTLGELRACTKAYLASLPGVGDTTIRNITVLLDELGYELSYEDTP